MTLFAVLQELDQPGRSGLLVSASLYPRAALLRAAGRVGVACAVEADCEARLLVRVEPHTRLGEVLNEALAEALEGP